MAEGGYNYEDTMATLFNDVLVTDRHNPIVKKDRVFALIDVLNNVLNEETHVPNARDAIQAFADKIERIRYRVNNFTIGSWIHHMNEWKNENNDKAENMAKYLYDSILYSPDLTLELYTEIGDTISYPSGGKRKSRKMKKSHKRRSRKSRKSRKMKKSHKRKSSHRKSSHRKSSRR